MSIRTNHRNDQAPANFGPQPEGLTLVDAPDNSIVCVVDDDVSVLKATGRLLLSAGLKVKPFSDPLEFLQYAEVYHPRLVVLDIRMPIMNGLEVQTRLRTISPATRVVVLTSKDDPS